MKWKGKNVIFSSQEIKKISALLILIGIILASIPTIYWLKMVLSPKDPSAEFVLLYDNADVDFGTTIDYSMIEYFIDNQSYFTDASGIISFEFNDRVDHIFQITWQGVLYERIFNTSISEEVLLATKSIDSLVLWSEIDLPAIDSGYLEAFDLLFFNSSEWIIIETVFTDATGMISISALIHGLYALSETGDMETLFTFEIDQSQIVYTENIFTEPDKTILSISYLNTFMGMDYPLDLTTVDYTLQLWSSSSSVWIDIPISLYTALVIDEINGLISFYELFNASNPYRIVINNSWDVNYEFRADDVVEIDLVAKSLEASFTWSDDSIAENETVSLYFNDGIGWILVGDYVTNALGKVVITEILPIGEYRIDSNTPFFITVDDVVKIVAYTIESIFRESYVFYLDSIVGSGIQVFFFFMLKV